MLDLSLQALGENLTFLKGNRFLQLLLIIASSCFLEDPARCVIGPLVGADVIEWWFAILGMTLGGMVGDLGLYLIGRLGTAVLIRRRWLNRARLVWIKQTFRHHAVKAMLLARYLPGTRGVTYISAGVARYPFPKAVLLLFLAAFSQAVLFTIFGHFLGEAILPWMQKPWFGWAVLAIIIFPILIVYQVASRKAEREGGRKPKV